MIAHHVRAFVEWWRSRRALPTLPADLARAEREARQLEFLRHAHRHRADARRMFTEAQAVECFAERHSIYCQALAAECRGEACHALAGGDADSAAQHTMEAAKYERLAGLPVEAAQPVEPTPGMAAHA